VKGKIFASLVLGAWAAMSQIPAQAGYDDFLVAARNDKYEQPERDRKSSRKERDYRNREDVERDRFEGYGRGYEEREHEKEKKEKGYRR
jgi:hypothetical protein